MTTLALFGDIGGGELLVVFTAILLLFGGKRLPSVARQLRRALDELRRSSNEFKAELLKAGEPEVPPPAATVPPNDSTQDRAVTPNTPTPHDRSG